MNNKLKLLNGGLLGLIFSIYVITSMVQAASNQTSLVIDDFAINEAMLVIVVDASTSFPAVVSNYVDGPTINILGGERDLQLTLENSAYGQAATAGVDSLTFQINMPGESSGYALLQYDGDDGSMNLNATGLTNLPGAEGGFNLEQNGNANFNLTYKSNVALQGFIYVYDVISALCSLSVPLPAASEATTNIVSFDDFVGLCNFQKVGAIEFFFKVDNNTVFVLYELSTVPDPPPISTIIIEDFTISSPPMFLLITRNKTPFQTIASYQEDATGIHIIGGERDFELAIVSGPPNIVTSVDILYNCFSYDTFMGVTGYSILQYDGYDGTMDLNIKGLGGVNFMTSTSNSFNITYQSTYEGEANLNVYDINGGTCTFTVQFVETESAIVSLIPFNLFTGNCDFHLVGAIELYVNGEYNGTDLFIYTFNVVST